MYNGILYIIIILYIINIKIYSNIIRTSKVVEELLKKKTISIKLNSAGAYFARKFRTIIKVALK